MDAGSIFRHKSIEKISSPEQLNDYIQVTTPSVWMVLLAVIVLLLGTFFWSVFGEIRVNTKEGVKAVAPITCIFPMGED